MQIKKIVMSDPRLNYDSSFCKGLKILHESDHAVMRGFVVIDCGGRIQLVNKDHIVTIEPESMERW